MADGGDNPQLKSVKTMIRSVVMSVKEGVAAHQLEADYEDFTGERIPYKSLGYSSLDSFIRSIPDVISVKVIHGVDVYFAVADENTRDLQNLILRQKTNPKKNLALKKGPPTRYPKSRSQISRTPPSSGGGFRPRPLRANQSKSFGHQKPLLGYAPVRAKSPILPTPASFSSEKLTPLRVTFRNTREEEGERERVIERQGGGNGGRQMAHRAIKDLVGQRQQDKKGLRYEMPPRFQKLFSNKGKANDTEASSVSAKGRPVEDDHADIDIADLEKKLPNNLKEWTADLVKVYSSGLWSTRLEVLYREEFGHPAPAYLIDVVKTWTDITHVELNTVANRHVIYPATTRTAYSPAVSVTSNDSAATNNITNSSTVRPITVAVSPPSEPAKMWQNFTVPPAKLFSEQEAVSVYASTSTDLGNFYLQRSDFFADDLTELIQSIEKDLAVPTLSDLQPGVFCAALYSKDGNWYRAQVITVKSSTEVHVTFIDYGNDEIVSMDNIRCLTEEIAAEPAQAVPCGLFALKPLGNQTEWSKEAISQFHDLLGDATLFIASCSLIENGRCMVELWLGEGEGKTSVNAQLYGSGVVDTYIQMDFDPPDIELPQENFLKVLVAYVDLKRCWLRIIGKEYSEMLEPLEDRLEGLYRQGQGQPWRLQEDSVCIAQFNFLYHRVKIKKIKDDQANCFFVDHGYTERIPLNQLVPMDKEINKSLPYQAVWCVLVGLDIYMSNPITITELLERTKNKICVAEVIVRDPLKLMLYDTNSNDDVNINEEIAKKLVAEGHVIDMTLFSPVSDNISEGSRASSPRSVSGCSSTVTDNTAVPVTTDAEQLGAGTLTLKSSTVNPSSVIDDKATPPVTVTSVSSEHVPPEGSKTEVSAHVSVPVSSGAVSPVDVVASPYGDSLRVTYNAWALPPYVQLPDLETFFPVFVQSVVDPSNFVVVPHNMLSGLEEMMMKMNARFNPHFATDGDSSSVQTPTGVPSLQTNHLYMAIHNGLFYRAVFLSTMDDMHHVLLPDYCFFAVIQPGEIFLLPKPFWSFPFSAFRASLCGVKPAGAKMLWSESVKYKFTETALHKTLMAVIKKVKEREPVGDGPQLTANKLSLHLVDTSDPDKDVVISDLLLAMTSGVASDS